MNTMKTLYGCGHCGATMTWPVIYYALPNLRHYCPVLECYADMRLMNGPEIEVYWKGQEKINEEIRLSRERADEALKDWPI